MLSNNEVANIVINLVLNSSHLDQDELEYGFEYSSEGHVSFSKELESKIDQKLDQKPNNVFIETRFILKTEEVIHNKFCSVDCNTLL